MKNWIDMTYEEKITYANDPPVNEIPPIKALLQPDPDFSRRLRCSCCGMGAPRQTAMRWEHCPLCHSKLDKAGVFN